MYTTLSKKEISLGKKIAKGGEGEVFEILGNSDNCIKIYHKHLRSDEKEEKIKYMVANPPSDLQGINYKICWAKDVIYKEGEFVGFMMSKAFDDSLLPYHLCQPVIPKKLDKKWHNTFDRETFKGKTSRLKLSVNIVAAVNRIHNTKKYVIVDLKPQNLLVTALGKVSVIDMDSVQIIENKKVLFKAPVSTPEYTPPEASDIVRSKIPITKDWDTFSLGVLVYEILCGIHPYVGSAKPPFDNLNTIQSKIKENLTHVTKGESAFSMLPPLHKTFNEYSFNLKNIFKRIFCHYEVGVTVRPSSEEFGESLFNAVVILEEDFKKEEQNRLEQEKARKKLEDEEALRNYKKVKQNLNEINSNFAILKDENKSLTQKLKEKEKEKSLIIAVFVVLLLSSLFFIKKSRENNLFLESENQNLKNSQKDIRNSVTPDRKPINKVLSKTQNKPSTRKNSQKDIRNSVTPNRKSINKVLSKTQNKPSTRKNSQAPSVSYLYKTTFDNPVFKVPLRFGPSLNEREIYSCPKDAKVYVLNESNKTFYKVSVDGYTGYVSSALIKKN